eukprot:403335893
MYDHMLLHQEQVDHNFTVNDNFDGNLHNQRTDQNAADFEIEQLEISFEDDSSYNQIISKSSPVRQKQLNLLPERPISNIEDPLLCGDIDEGYKNNDFNNKTPLRETQQLSQHNKFQNNTANQIREKQKQNTNKQLNFANDQVNMFQGSSLNYFEPINDLDQDEIDQILAQNNISPLKSNSNNKQESLEINGMQNDLDHKLNMMSDFNFDYIDNDDLENEDLNQNSQRKHFEGDVVGHETGEDEIFQDLERRRQVTHESNINDQNKKREKQQELRDIEKSSRKQTSSAIGYYGDQHLKSDSIVKMQLQAKVGKHSSKKSQVTNTSAKRSEGIKHSFQEYYSTNPNRSVRNKPQASSTSVNKQTSLTTSQDSQKGRKLKLEKQAENKPITNMKLDIIKKKLNSMKSQYQNDNKPQQPVSKLPPSLKETSKSKDQKYKFQRIELPEANSDGGSGDDKQVPQEKETLQDRRLHNNMIPKFNEIQSKTELDRKSSPLRSLKERPITTSNNNSKLGKSQIEVFKVPRLNVAKIKQSQSPFKNSSTNITFHSKPEEEKQYSKDRIALKNHIIQELRTNQHNKLVGKIIHEQSTSTLMNKVAADPYERYKQKILIESKLKEAPVISQENLDLNLQSYSIHSVKSNQGIQQQLKKANDKSQLSLKQFSSLQHFQPAQPKAQIKSVRVIDKAALDHLKEKHQVKEDAKLIKELQILENKEKSLKSQIDKIQNQLEKRKKDEEVTNIQVKCLYKNKLEQMRSNESQVQQNIIKMKNSKILHAQQSLESSNEKQKGLNYISKQKNNTIDQEDHSSLSNRQVNRTPNQNVQTKPSTYEPGYQQLNRANFAKIGMNSQSLTPQHDVQVSKIHSKLKQNSQLTPQAQSQIQIKHVVQASQEKNQLKTSQLESKSANNGETQTSDRSPHLDKSPGYYHVSKQPFNGFNIQKNPAQLNVKSNNEILSFTIVEDQDDNSIIRNEHGDKSQKRASNLFFDKNHQNQIAAQIEIQQNLKQSIPNKSSYRPLTAIQKPIATLGNNYIKELKQKREESTQQNSNEKQINDESSIISGYRVDLSMIAKGTDQKYTREELLKMKKRMDSISPQKGQSQKPSLEIIKESQLPIYASTNRDTVKRVSFKEASISMNDIQNQSAINNNFKYNKDVVDMQLSNQNIVNRKSFEQTFNPKKEGGQVQSQTQNVGNHTRNQSVLQSYKEQVINRKNKQHLQDQSNKSDQIIVDQAQIDNMKNKPSISSKFFNSVIENQTKNKQSILKNSTIDPPVAQYILRQNNSQRINNHTLNETLKVKINQEEERDNKHQRDVKDETIQTIRSRENRSLDKSGIDFMTEARDFSNIIQNLKNLLHKGNQMQQNQNSHKSFMTLDQRASSKMSSINHSYITNVNQHVFQNNLNSSMINNHQNQQQMIDRNHFAQQKRSISSQSTINQGTLQFNPDNKRLTQNFQPVRGGAQNIHEPQILLTMPDNTTSQLGPKSHNQQMNQSQNSINQNQAYEERRKRDFDLKLQRDVKALESILTRKHQEMRTNYQQNGGDHNQSMMSQKSHQRVGSFNNQSIFDQNRQSIVSSRSISVQRPSTTKMLGLMTFGQGVKNQQINHNQQQQNYQSLTPRGNSLSGKRRSFGIVGNFLPSENMGTLLQSIKEAEEQLELLKGESNTIEQQIVDLRSLRSPPS